MCSGADIIEVKMRFGSSNTWKPRILNAAVLDQSRFCVSVGRLEYDDPFSAILLFDGAHPQPWERIDVQRELADITPLWTGHLRSKGFYAAISSEGDVYFVGQETITGKIPGAGIASSDAIGLGAMYCIADTGNRIVATGASGQIYMSADGFAWQKAFPELGPQGPYEPVGYGKAAVLDSENVLIVGSAYPDRSNVPDLTEKVETWDDYDAAVEEEEKLAKILGIPESSTPFAVLGSGDKWRELPLSTLSLIKDVYVESENRIWMVGTDGAILVGNIAEGFKDISFHGDGDKTLLSITKYRDRMVIASDYGLHWFDGHLLSPLKPKIDPSINNGVPTPLKVHAVDDILFYFDYKHGVHRFDGENWEEILIPPELLERDFKGLPPRK
jgi:hypothetical protein